MNMTCLHHVCVSALLLATLAVVAHGAEGSGKAKVLDPADKQVKKLVVTQSQIGYRNTLVFYTFADPKVILRVTIDNQNTDFPVAATLFTFAADVTDEGLAHWLNNQHSDGLYPDVPEPTASEVPAKSLKAVTHKRVGQDKKFNGTFDKYMVEFQISGAPELKGTQIKDFSDSVPVHVKTK
jgi:hypothetical protein